MAGDRVLDRAPVARGVLLRVDERDPPGSDALQRLHLVLHQRDERGDDQRQVRPHQRGQLVAERLARAGRHDHEHVAVRQRRADRVLLPGPEALEAEQLVQRPVRVARASDRLGRRRPETGQGEGRCGFHGPPDITPGPGGF